jgi:hypothetical protein
VPANSGGCIQAYDTVTNVKGFPDTARILRQAGVGKRPGKNLADQRLEFSDTNFPTPGRR